MIGTWFVHAGISTSAAEVKHTSARSRTRKNHRSVSAFRRFFVEPYGGYLVEPSDVAG
jgi:hypothetical protein